MILARAEARERLRYVHIGMIAKEWKRRGDRRERFAFQRPSDLACCVHARQPLARHCTGRAERGN